jgi:dUTP pyrophosphatase
MKCCGLLACPLTKPLLEHNPPERHMMKLKLKRLTETAKLPIYATDGAACFDLHADIVEDTGLAGALEIPGGGSAAISTGLAFEIPRGYCMRVYSRSGHGFHYGVRLSNCTGIIDSDYRGQVFVKLHNDHRLPFLVRHGDRIAQAELAMVIRTQFEEAESLSDTARGASGRGSTGR